MTIRGIVCGPRLYEYEGWFFEVTPYGGPWPLKNNGNPRKRAGNTFYSMYEKFDKLSKKEKLKYRVGGGCQPFGDWS
jgi:hypothetical protein